MSQLDPNFRGADEVVVPEGAQFGWTDGTLTEAEAVLREKYGQERIANDMPVACRASEPFPIDPAVAKAWNDFQKSKGRGEGSQDWSLLDEFVFKVVLLWLPQIIGSCVVSNTFRGYVIKWMYQIVFQGMAMEYLGRNEFGPKNLAFYGPWSYGMARRRVNLRGGDGLFCEGIQESLLKDGILPCNTPALLELLARLRANGDKDFPEPQSATVYRRFGNWEFLDELKPYADYTLEECPFVKSVDDLDKALETASSTFICSMIAIKKVGTHKDGFAIHARDTGDQWAHNMCFHGKFKTVSNNEPFFRFSNESWGPSHIYNVTYNEADDWFKRRNVTAASIGKIHGPKSAPPLLTV